MKVYMAILTVCGVGIVILLSSCAAGPTLAEVPEYVGGVCRTYEAVCSAAPKTPGCPDAGRD